MLIIGSREMQWLRDIIHVQTTKPTCLLPYSVKYSWETLIPTNQRVSSKFNLKQRLIFKVSQNIYLLRTTK